MNKWLMKLKQWLKTLKAEDRVKINISENGVVSVTSDEYFRHEKTQRLMEDLKHVKVKKYHRKN